MLARIHFGFLLFFSFSLSVVAVVVSSASAQVNGVPASVTSLGFGGHDNPAPGVRASVTSLGPNGYGSAQAFLSGCCGNFFWSPERSRGWQREHRRDHRGHRDAIAYVPIAVPAYVPYGYPYAADEEDEDSDSYDAYAYASEATAGKRAPAGKRTSRRASTAEADAKAAATEQSETPVAVQPATILVFKDGHRSEVVNYAIVGDTLFEFAEERTRKIQLASLDLAATQKANEERGVEFKLPPAN